MSERLASTSKPLAGHGPRSGEHRAFVAGASGAIGRVLCRLLIQDGWQVTGTTRSPAKATELRSLGVEPVVVDVFDREALIRSVAAAAPRVVIHQLTDLPKVFSAETMAAARPRNARIREIGTDNLVAAASRAGARRLVAQSIAFAYAPGPRPYVEEAALDLATAPAVAKLEALVLDSGLDGLVLRYGRLYGPGTWADAPAGEAPVHVDAAADAARRAATIGARGIYNIAEEDGTVSSAKARAELGWSSQFRAPALT
ncbi:MAG: NAD-dependent epimerase/dehydratase family protein [Candidatus Levyibacteriota bacterium]